MAHRRLTSYTVYIEIQKNGTELGGTVPFLDIVRSDFYELIIILLYQIKLGVSQSIV